MFSTGGGLIEIAGVDPKQAPDAPPAQWRPIMRNTFLVTAAAALLALAAASPALASGNGSGPDQSFPPNGVMVIGTMQPAAGAPPAASFNALFDRAAAPAHGCGPVAVHGQTGGVTYEDRCW